jgi:hypothetical protein
LTYGSLFKSSRRVALAEPLVTPTSRRCIARLYNIISSESTEEALVTPGHTTRSHNQVTPTTMPTTSPPTTMPTTHTTGHTQCWSHQHTKCWSHHQVLVTPPQVLVTPPSAGHTTKCWSHHQVLVTPPQVLVTPPSAGHTTTSAGPVPLVQSDDGHDTRHFVSQCWSQVLVTQSAGHTHPPPAGGRAAGAPSAALIAAVASLRGERANQGLWR